MRKLLAYSILVSVFFYQAAIAEVSVGLKFGGNGSTQYGDIKENSLKTGFFGGPFVTFDMGESFAIQPEVRFSMKGTKQKVSGFNVSQMLNYIEVPILLKIKFLQENEIRPSFYFGPEVSFLLTADYEILDTTFDVKDQYNNLDAGVVFGVDFNNDRNLLSDFRVGLGFLNLVDEDAGNATNRNLNISIGIGFMF